eukprot:GHRR01033648.1.p1 GENE.GHRR01033648.1~~GHRR01033648.1.p1  ORF type:complete len:127 (-),score=20.36 GHRR01033648.1:249-629(-)
MQRAVARSDVPNCESSCKETPGVCLSNKHMSRRSLLEVVTNVVNVYLPLLQQVQLSASDLSGFQVASDQVMQHYKYKNLKAAMSNIPTSKDVGGPVFTKVGRAVQGQELTCNTGQPWPNVMQCLFQ